MTIEDYVHRVGRTGRAGATGTAVTFFTKANGRLTKELIDVLVESKQHVPEELYSLRGRSAPGRFQNNRFNDRRGQKSRSPRRFY